MRGKPRPGEEVKKAPTIEEFQKQFMDQHARAEQQKPSTIWSKEQVLRTHVVPMLGKKRLDEVTAVDVQRLKASMQTLSPKTVNNSLTVLNVMLKKAVEWGVIKTMPVYVKLMKTTHTEREFYDFDVYEGLVSASARIDAATLVLVLLGGDAGLREGEIIALEWPHVDFNRGVVKVKQAWWCGHITTPKGNRIREVPMTQRLKAALLKHRHLRGPRVLYRESGETLTERVVRNWMRSAERRATMRISGRIHILRHTFCSHLAMRGATAKAIQELAGHADLTTTMRYMHLSPGHRESAIKLLDSGHAAGLDARAVGDILETEGKRGVAQVVNLRNP
jgi:integrase